jgi:hypothetical protein
MSAVVIIAILWLFIQAYFIFSRFNWGEMDWNNDKMTTIKEVMESIDIDKRHTQTDDTVCVEYFSLKDALTIKLVCNEKNAK